MNPVSLPAMTAKIVDAELEMVSAFRAAAAIQFAKEKLRLAKATVDGKSDHVYEDFLADQCVIALEILELAEELAIVAAYRVVELTAKRLTRWLDKTYTHFSWSSFARLLLSKVAVDIKTLDGASSVDELRLLSNAIKHEAKVTEELSRYPEWTVGARVHPLGPCFERLTPAISPFVEALAKAVMPTNLGGNRPDETVIPIAKGNA